MVSGRIFRFERVCVLNVEFFFQDFDFDILVICFVIIIKRRNNFIVERKITYLSGLLDPFEIIIRFDRLFLACC